MPVRAEFQIVGSPAEVAVQRISGSDSMTLVAIAHEASQKRLALIAGWAKPPG